MEQQPEVPASRDPAQQPPGHAQTAPGTASIASARAAAGVTRRVVSLKNERQCLRCRRWFWAWDTERTVCYFCEP